MKDELEQRAQNKVCCSDSPLGIYKLWATHYRHLTRREKEAVLSLHKSCTCLHSVCASWLVKPLHSVKHLKIFANLLGTLKHYI